MAFNGVKNVNVPGTTPCQIARKVNDPKNDRFLWFKNLSRLKMYLWKKRMIEEKVGSGVKLKVKRNPLCNPVVGVDVEGFDGFLGFKKKNKMSQRIDHDDDFP